MPITTLNKQSNFYPQTHHCRLPHQPGFRFHQVNFRLLYVLPAISRDSMKALCLTSRRVSHGGRSSLPPSLLPLYRNPPPAL